MTDTSSEAERIQLDLFRGMTPSQRLARFCELMDVVEGMQKAGIRRQYPHISDHEMLMRLALRRIGPELTKRVYGWEDK